MQCDETKRDATRPDMMRWDQTAIGLGQDTTGSDQTRQDKHKRQDKREKTATTTSEMRDKETKIATSDGDNSDRPR